MIESLNGVKETVWFRENLSLKLFDNHEYEEYPTHWHTPLEIIMPLQSAYGITCNGTSFSIGEYEILVICPGTLHSMPACKGERIIFQIDFSLLREINALESTLSLIAPYILITRDNSPDYYQNARELILSVLKEYQAGSTLMEASIYAKVIELFVLIGRNYAKHNNTFTVQDSKQKEYTEKFMYVCDYINTHCLEDLTLDQAAEIAGFSKYHFSRLFRQFTGNSYYQYLNRKRIDHAAALLRDPDMPVTEVALHSGFSSISSFIRMFKIINGCTPTEFKRYNDNYKPIPAKDSAT